MTDPRPDPGRRTPLAGGVFIAAGAVVGAVVGVLYDQPSLGMVIGLGLGIVLALATWLLDRR